MWKQSFCLFSPDICKALDTVWIDGMFYKLFTELDINGRFWLILKDLCTDADAKVFLGICYAHSQLSRVLGRGEFLHLHVQGVYKELTE